MNFSKVKIQRNKNNSVKNDESTVLRPLNVMRSFIVARSGLVDDVGFSYVDGKS